MQKPDFLPIDFIIIGGGVAGLMSAVALSRVGHRVTLLEQRDDFAETVFSGGCRMAPNITRVLYNWGLEEELKKISVLARYVQFARYEDGSVAAKGEWVHDFKVESDGEFLQVHYADFRKLLHDTAVKFGANIRSNAKVTAISVRSEKPSVTLATGEEVVGDALIGADGNHSISRKHMLGEKDGSTRKKIVMYNTAIPVDSMASDPELAPFLATDVGMVASWFGDGYGVMGFPSMRGLYHMHVYTPEAEESPIPFPIASVDTAHLINAMKNCEPRLRKMVELATSVLAVPVTESPQLEDWLQEDGPFLVIGEAAHPLTTGSIFSLSQSAADGAMLGRLFYHLRRKDQIPIFLSALAELRHKRVLFVEGVQSKNPATMSLPAGVEHRGALAAAMSMQDGAALEMTQEAIREIFVYDPEDEADNWCVQWGLMQETAASIAPVTFDVAIDQHKEESRS